MKAPSWHKGSVKIAITAITAAVVAVSGAGVWLFNGDEGPEQPGAGAPRFIVRRGNLRITLKKKGPFDAAEAMPVTAQISGSAKIVWLVEAGTAVNKDDVLVELDRTNVENQIEQYKSQVVKAEADLVAAQADQEITRLSSESKIRTAEMDVEMAGLEVKKFLDGVKPKELRDATIKIDQAKVKLSQVTSVAARMPEMLKQGFVTKEEVEESELDVQTAENALGSAKLEHEILAKYTHPMRLKQLRSDKLLTAAELERFKEEAKRRKAQTSATTTQRELELASAKRQLAEARERLEKMTIHAPGDGIVVYGSGRQHRWRQEEELAVGSTAHQNQTLMRLPNLNTMQLVVEVHEADINKIRIDEEHPQQAIVTTDYMPGKGFPAYVKGVDTLAQSNWYKQNIKFFLTTIALEKQIPGIRPGTTATAEIFISQLDNILLVPIQCVDTVGGVSYCYMADTGKKREVVVGASNNTFVEIKRGLKEGETVLLERPAAAAAEQEQPDNADKQRPELKPPSTRARGKGAR